jgi:hypothetical protein
MRFYRFYILALFAVISANILPLPAEAAGYSISTDISNEEAVVSVTLDNGGACVYAGSVEVIIPKGYVLLSIDRELSPFTIWLPDATTSDSVIVSGGTPGFCGTFFGSGIVNTIATFRFLPDTIIEPSFHFGSSTTLIGRDDLGEPIYL